MPHDPSDPSALKRRPFRAAAIAGAAAASLVLGAAGVIAFDPGSDLPTSWQPVASAFQTTLPGSGVDDCPERQAGASLLSVALQEPAGTAAGQETGPSIADIADRAQPAVVTVINRSADVPAGFPIDVLPGDDATVPVGSGSGFILDADGRVVTNSHVVAGADELEVQFFDGTETTATVIGRDAFQDIAVLQLDLADGQEVPATLAFGDSDAVRTGEDVVAIGSSLGQFTNTVSRGIVGAADRALPGVPNLIQHDAPIYPGNSGGPLLNLAGEVIGVNVAGVSDIRTGSAPAQIALAIQSNAASEVVAELIATGSVRRAWLGISGAAIDGGQLVAEVVPDAPAAQAGVEADDLIVAIDGERLTNRVGVLDLLAEREPGETVRLTVERAGAEQELDVTLGERPADTD